MSTLNNALIYQKWSRFILNIYRDPELMENFYNNPTSVLIEEGIIGDQATVLVKPSNEEGKELDVVISYYSEVLFIPENNSNLLPERSLWTELVKELNKDLELKSDFKKNPRPTLIKKGLMKENDSYIVLPKIGNDREFELLLCYLSDVLSIPNKANINAYFENLPRNDYEGRAPGCSVPGGCSTI